ncbi:winged helix-turn-helix domain-containing protein [Micromonospora sp. WMMD1102]|uniref:ArsR/SmtB family transcription factor n=1 Tax=Micromonospora sp. WMMD1102 TaxID=3016105 RepID=UPI002414E1A0|nr:winged helix-turn-helix domain-containing protein [Micromonospora sp. WMMD1102]MDG4788513.1 winged helix-turn-helix domain-containing protein [Micromonospora sp. WMMD1102]
MIRIWLGPEDIARTRIAPAPLPLYEVVVSLAGAPAGDAPDPVAGPDLAGWLRELAESTGAGPAGVAGPAGSAELLAPLSEDRTLEGALAWLLTTSAGRGRSLAAAVRGYYERRIGTELAAWESVVRLDVNERSRALATGGVQALLAMFDPWAVWRNPVLSVTSAVDLDLRPNGTGLLLVPSVFARRPWVGTRPDSVVLGYPVRRPRTPGSRAPGHRPVPAYALAATAATGDPLTALLGRSRAAVLRAALVGANTTDLARRAGISTPSASQHASVLRDAGLLRTTRHGKAAHHTLTPLARALLSSYDAVTRH